MRRKASYQSSGVRMTAGVSAGRGGVIPPTERGTPMGNWGPGHGKAVWAAPLASWFPQVAGLEATAGMHVTLPTPLITGGQPGLILHRLPWPQGLQQDAQNTRAQVCPPPLAPEHSCTHHAMVLVRACSLGSSAGVAPGALPAPPVRGRPSQNPQSSLLTVDFLV